ncbi:MAG: addiction module antidote protein, HigA family [Candidatus Omnitrophota bacterium]|jgi:addiction module HigA family antidote|nr:MAG: addiction module antidote protein, HigA family [Candidatus Omnitrophota bacterium]
METIKKMPPVHPGEILQEEYLKPLAMTQKQLARALRVSPHRISEIIQGKRSVTTDTALRLARFFKTSPQFWLNMQMHYDLEVAEDTRLVQRIHDEVRENRIVSENQIAI